MGIFGMGIAYLPGKRLYSRSGETNFEGIVKET